MFSPLSALWSLSAVDLFIDGHWCEWYDEEGYSIDELGTLEDFVVGNYVVDDYYYMTKISEIDDTNAYGKVGYDVYRKEIMEIPFNSPIKLLRSATEKEISIHWLTFN